MDKQEIFKKRMAKERETLSKMPEKYKVTEELDDQNQHLFTVKIPLFTSKFHISTSQQQFLQGQLKIASNYPFV